MRAIVITRHGGPEVLRIHELPDPVPADGEVLIRNQAFGLNRAEIYMRNGSYAEPVSVPAPNVVPVQTALSWTDLVAIPEVYAAAWSGLHGNLALQPGQTLLVRGATSALGQAAVNIAAELGATVLATTRSTARVPLLRQIGAAEVLIDGRQLAEPVRARHADGVDAVLDLVGNPVLLDSLQCAHPHGRVCQMGFLGGHAPVQDFDLLVDLPSCVQLSFFASFVMGTPHFPLSDMPLTELIAKAEAGIYQAKPAHIFAFDEIALAHRMMESNSVVGKMVVRVP